MTISGLTLTGGLANGAGILNAGNLTLKRAEAKACFRRSMDTGAFDGFDEYIWSRAFLARIDDPDWPPWVPAKG